MKYPSLQFPYLLILSFFFIQACGDDDSTDENSCIGDLLGIWQVTGFIPSSANCSGLTTYEISTGSANNILSLSIFNDTRTLSGSGLVNTNCTEMTYTVSQGQSIVSGAISFNGRMFEDQSDLGCLVSASKQ